MILVIPNCSYLMLIIVMGDSKNIGSITITITFRTKYRWYRLLKRLLIGELS